jgi:hypothetical protein
MTVEIVASPEPSPAQRHGPAVVLGMILTDFRSLRRNHARAFEDQALAFITSTPARDACLVRRHPGRFELRFILTRPLRGSDPGGEQLMRELCARMIELVEAGGRTGVFGLEFFPLGYIDPLPRTSAILLLPKTATILQAGLVRTPLQWRRAFDPEPC